VCSGTIIAYCDWGFYVGCVSRTRAWVADNVGSIHRPTAIEHCLQQTCVLRCYLLGQFITAAVVCVYVLFLA
jgi:hypothetical protein